MCFFKLQGTIDSDCTVRPAAMDNARTSKMISLRVIPTFKWEPGIASVGYDNNNGSSSNRNSKGNNNSNSISHNNNSLTDSLTDRLTH